MRRKTLRILMMAGLFALGGAFSAGAQECADCHDQAAEFAATAHGRAFPLDADYSQASCESCHGSGAEHAETAEPAAIRNPARLEGASADEACLSCHGNEGRQAAWQGGLHESAGVACVDCHAVHAALPPRREGRVLEAKAHSATELCLSCHLAQRKGLTQRSSHPLFEEKMQCTSCHDPHGGDERLVAADSINDLCYSCHQEKRGPFLWEHSPVREDCLTCHTPHGSNHEGMLVARTNQLCQSCHLQGRHQTVAGFETAMWNINRGCVNCHPQIHGSNHPSGVLFQR